MNYTVDVVDKALCLLFMVAERPGLGVTELAKRSGITKARSYRLLKTLERSGLVRRQGNAAIYSLSYMALVLGNSAQEQIKTVRLAKTHLGDIGIRLNEHTSVQVRDGHDSICIAHWDSQHRVRSYTKIGMRKPLYMDASGKLLMACATAEVLDSLLAGMKSDIGRSLVATEKLKEELEKIRSQGHSISYGAPTTDAVAVAVPVRDAFGAVIAALSITVPVSCASIAQLDAFLGELRKVAFRFSSDLGYVGAFADW